MKSQLNTLDSFQHLRGKKQQNPCPIALLHLLEIIYLGAQCCYTNFFASGTNTAQLHNLSVGTVPVPEAYVEVVFIKLWQKSYRRNLKHTFIHVVQWHQQVRQVKYLGSGQRQSSYQSKKRLAKMQMLPRRRVSGTSHVRGGQLTTAQSTNTASDVQQSMMPSVKDQVHIQLLQNINTHPSPGPQPK